MRTYDMCSPDAVNSAEKKNTFSYSGVLLSHTEMKARSSILGSSLQETELPEVLVREWLSAFP